jgi:hypothetical protein
VSGTGPAVQGQELVDGAGRVASDLGGVEVERVAEEESNLDIAADQAEESPEGGLASSTGLTRAPMARRPFASTMAPRFPLREPACAMAMRLSTTEVRPAMTSSQLTAKSSRRSRRVSASRAPSASRPAWTREACQRTVAVRRPSRSPNHL